MRRDILAELDAGLRDAAEAHRAAGLETGQAARAAVAEFGSPEQVASGFRGELRTAQARRTALALLATGPLVGAAWAGTALASHIGAHLTAPWQWDGMTAGARLATHLGLVVLLTAIASALFTVATTGRLTRWVRARPPASAALAASGTAAMDLTLLTLLVTQAATAPGRLAALPAVLAAAASLTRLVLAGRAARRCLAPVAYPA
jgi:cytochrome bd-type quinol oxidase subunit 2